MTNYLINPTSLISLPDTLTRENGIVKDFNEIFFTRRNTTKREIYYGSSGSPKVWLVNPINQLCLVIQVASDVHSTGVRDKRNEEGGTRDHAPAPPRAADSTEETPITTH